MNWRTKHTLVLVALILSAGGWLTHRLLSQRHNAVFPNVAMTQSAATSPAVAPDLQTTPSTQCINLSPHFNDSLDDGWQHRFTPGNNLGTLRRGQQVFGGVKFDVRGIIQLTSWQLRRLAISARFPEQVRGIHVGRKCRQLYFLHATGWDEAPGTWVGTYMIHYADGTWDDAPILYGEGTGNWWAKPADLKRPGDAVVWQGTNAAKQAVQLFKQSWTNPHPDLEIKSLDFETRRTRVAPFLIAATAE